MALFWQLAVHIMTVGWVSVFRENWIWFSTSLRKWRGILVDKWTWLVPILCYSPATSPIGISWHLWFWTFLSCRSSDWLKAALHINWLGIAWHCSGYCLQISVIHNSFPIIRNISGLVTFIVNIGYLIITICVLWNLFKLKFSTWVCMQLTDSQVQYDLFSKAICFNLHELNLQ